MNWYKLWHEGLKYVGFKGQVSKVLNSFEIPNLSCSVSIHFYSHSRLKIFETVLYVHLEKFFFKQGICISIAFSPVRHYGIGYHCSENNRAWFWARRKCKNKLKMIYKREHHTKSLSPAKWFVIVRLYVGSIINFLAMTSRK